MRIFIIILPLILAACYSPRPLFLESDVPGPPEYKMGWKHGCDSGLATYGTAIYKLSHKFYQDYDMLKDRHYSAGWHEGFDYCRHHSLKWNVHDWTSD